MVSTIFILDKEDIEALKKISQYEDRSVNAIIRLAIKQYLKGEL